MTDEKEYITIDLPTDLFTKLALEAHELDMKFNDYIIQELMNYINCNLGESNDNKSKE